MSFLVVDHVSKYFPGHAGGGEVCIFKDVTLKVDKGEFVTVIGHSGCGKSTLLNIIAGLETLSEGGVVLNGREVSGPGLDRMVVFQNFCPHALDDGVREHRSGCPVGLSGAGARNRWSRTFTSTLRWSGSRGRRISGLSPYQAE